MVLGPNPRQLVQTMRVGSLIDMVGPAGRVPLSFAIGWGGSDGKARVIPFHYIYIYNPIDIYYIYIYNLMIVVPLYLASSLP